MKFPVAVVGLAVVDLLASGVQEELGTVGARFHGAVARPHLVDVRALEQRVLLRVDRPALVQALPQRLSGRWASVGKLGFKVVFVVAVVGTSWHPVVARRQNVPSSVDQHAPDLPPEAGAPKGHHLGDPHVPLIPR